MSDILFQQSHLLAAAAGVALSMGGLAGASALLVPRIARRVLPAPQETRLADFLPYDRLAPDGTTVIGKDGSATRYLFVEGMDQGFLRDEEALALYRKRLDAIDSVAEKGVMLRIYSLREPVAVPNLRGYPNELAAQIANHWNERFTRSFVTHMVIAVTAKHPGKELVHLEEAVAALSTTLAAYGPRVMTQHPIGDAPGLTIGAFLGQLVSPLTRPRPNRSGGHLSEAITADVVQFRADGRIEYGDTDERLYSSVLGIQRFGDVAAAAMTADLLALPCRLLLLQTVEPVSKAKALFELKQNQVMMQGTSFSAEVADQYQAALELVEGIGHERSTLCFFSENVFLFANREAELKELEKMARQVVTNHGCTGIVERGATQAAWFLQHPSIDLKPRQYRLMSGNVAALASFNRSPAGMPRSFWGDGPIALLNTASNSVYMHQFHISMEQDAVGHSLCIAPTGAGKTTLFQFLSLMTSRHRDVRQFLFDRFLGTYVYTCAMGGSYLSFNSEKQAMSIKGGMNPFACEDTDDNREFLRGWLQVISGCRDPHSIQEIAQAVEMAFTLFPDPEDRSARSLEALFSGAFQPGSELRAQLEKWVDPDQYGLMFNAKEDCIDLDNAWLTSFDMTNLLQDEILAGASVHYFMHRIRQTLKRNSANANIFIDETEPLLRNEGFKRIFLIMLQELRKLGGSVTSVFQRPEALKASGISELVRQQCGTYYLFPNPGAQAKDYDEFDLNGRELDFILGDHAASRLMHRPLLIKRPSIRESVIVDIDLAPLGSWLKVFSSSSKDVARANQLQRQHGREAWLARYLESQAG